MWSLLHFLSLSNRFRVTVPTGLADFPHEAYKTPIIWAHHYYNVVHESDMSKGGHFAAFEQPELFVNDVSKFIQKIENLLSDNNLK